MPMYKEKSDLPLVSIVIPCFNSEQYISKCIESTLSQDYMNIEVIVIDDGSTDKSLEIINSFTGITVLTQQNSGACVARNLGLSTSRGKYVKFLDSDDFLEPNCISKQVQFCESLNPNQVGYGYKKISHDNSMSIDKVVLKPHKQFAQLISSNIVTTLPLHRRSVLIKINGFDERLKFRQEWDLHLRLAHQGFEFVFQDLCIYTQVMHDSPNRISSRKLNLDYEISNLNRIRGKFNHINDRSTNIAWAHKYWTMGRQFIKENRKTEAQTFFDLSKEIEPNSFLKLHPLPYQLSVRVFGPSISEKLIKATKLLIKQ